MPEHVRVSKGNVTRGEDGIVSVLWDPGAVVERSDIEAVLEAELLLIGDGPARVLVDARRVRSMTREAQRLTAEHPSARRTLGVAILIDGPISRVLGNFFLNVTRPIYPTRLFSDEQQARIWLRGQRG